MDLVCDIIVHQEWILPYKGEDTDPHHGEHTLISTSVVNKTDSQVKVTIS